MCGMFAGSGVDLAGRAAERELPFSGPGEQEVVDAAVVKDASGASAGAGVAGAGAAGVVAAATAAADAAADAAGAAVEVDVAIVAARVGVGVGAGAGVGVLVGNGAAAGEVAVIGHGRYSADKDGGRGEGAADMGVVLEVGPQPGVLVGMDSGRGRRAVSRQEKEARHNRGADTGAGIRGAEEAGDGEACRTVEPRGLSQQRLGWPRRGSIPGTFPLLVRYVGAKGRYWAVASPAAPSSSMRLGEDAGRSSW